MIAGVSGRLVGAAFARDVLPTLVDWQGPPASLSRALEAWGQRRERVLGPASSARAVTDVALMPLVEDILGYQPASRAEIAGTCRLRFAAGGDVEVAGLVVPFDEPLGRAWRAAVTDAIAGDSRWCFCCNGRALRVVDARRTWSREHLEFDLAELPAAAEAQALMWATLRAPAMAAAPPFLDRAVSLSARHGIEVCRALGGGVIDALRILLAASPPAARRRVTPSALFEQALTLLYRVLFLLFAEARGLVPVWHPVYRDRYSVESIVATLLSGGRYRGVSAAVQAISRLAHAGCTAGELTVTAFNGRLFSPAHARAFDRAPIDDGSMAAAIVAVATKATGRGGGRSRIAYRDLDVEQLGAVYEGVLEYEAVGGARVTLEKTGGARKATGTFYTPRTVTAYLVRRTLDPLLDGRTADEMARLRILDPAMGSGAFLVASCRHLASAIEDALIREGRWHAHDVTPADRAALRREVASRCLFGVDLNPMAVQLARLSIWLATLSAGRPLSFLDHHLVVGDSLVGATPADVRRHWTRGAGSRPTMPRPLFDDARFGATLEPVVQVRTRLTLEPDDTAEIIRSKERTLAVLQDNDGLGRWRRALDVWCAGWFWTGSAPPARGVLADLVSTAFGEGSMLPATLIRPLAERAASVAEARRFLHWPLAFPEVFVDERGAPLAEQGFDAVVGNPPWDVVRGDTGSDAVRAEHREQASQIAAFVRESGVYRVEPRAHVNRYQLFLERALQLVRPGGRLGLVLPSGVLADAGAGPLRRHLFDRAEVDEVTGLDNREAIFPTHRGLRFALLTCTAGRPTTSIRCRFGITAPDDLERTDPSGGTAPVVLTRSFLGRLSGEDDLGIPEISTHVDLALLERITAGVPRLSSEDGWNARFGRELNVTDDRHALAPFTGSDAARPVVEGKQLEPFRVALERCRHEVDPHSAASRRVPPRSRLAFRDVASATNRLTLIAAIVPSHAVTVHTVSCLRTPMTGSRQAVLCALLNSFVANYLIRVRVTTHVTSALMARLPVPPVRPGSPAFVRLGHLSGALAAASAPVEEMDEYAELQGLAARLYGLTPADFEHVLSTFRLIPVRVRQAALDACASLGSFHAESFR
jgi:hypothetical protein